MEFEAAATLQPRPLVDPFARAITYLRVSVTDRCDFRCVYCMAENMVFLPKQDLLSLEELDRLCSAFVAKGVRKLRLTGGEPLVRRGIMTLVASLARHLAVGDLDELTLTTKVARQTLVRYDHEYVLKRGATIIAQGETTIACVDRAWQVREIPAALNRRQD